MKMVIKIIINKFCGTIQALESIIVFFFWKNWYDKGIKYFGDILSENGSILSLTQFKEKFDLNVNFLNYFSLVHAIPQKWKRDVKIVDKEVNDNTFQEELILKLLKTKGKSILQVPDTGTSQYW